MSKVYFYIEGVDAASSYQNISDIDGFLRLFETYDEAYEFMKSVEGRYKHLCLTINPAIHTTTT